MSELPDKLKFEQKLENAVKENQAFVLFRKPDEEYLQLLVHDNSGLNKFIFHSFDSKTQKSISDRNPAVMKFTQFDFRSSLKLEPALSFTPLQKSEYEKLVSKTVDTLKNTEILKIVTSRIKQIENSGFDLFQSYSKMLNLYPNAFVYLWHNPGQETWIGATPELLLSSYLSDLKTVALAGTRLPDAEWTEKEYLEQQYVTDFIVDNLSDLPDLKTDGPYTVGAGNLRHLKTFISAKTDNKIPLPELLERIHPTPAVCGLPKKESFDYLIQNEGYDRQFYAGYMGYETEDLKEYFVNLRCGQFFKDKIWVYVGGGITVDSIPEKEWAETENKSRTLINALV